ncbi:MAG: hypothetical protein ACYST6_09390 [Planctomycetota bacterium]
MKSTKVLMIVVIGLLVVQCGCADKYKKAELDVKKPINCATAEGDIRMLQHEKAHVQDQLLQGVSAISPAGAVVGLVKGTEGAKMKVASGDYNKMIDKRIAEIKEHCGIK